MIRLFQRLRLWRKPKVAYEKQRNALADGGHRDRLALARDRNTKPEVLYYLAGDQHHAVRAALAGNPSLPLQADEILATDSNGEVRAELARKIGRLLPGMGEGEQNKLREKTVKILDTLARDQLPAVRAVLAEELKKSRNVPHHIVMKLAMDLESIVATPIIEFSPLLSDADLLELIAASKCEGALDAIARRSKVQGDVSDAIVATLDIPAVTALLTNPRAELREQALDTILDHAPQIEAWHKPLVTRAELSVRAMRRIAGFVASSLVNELITRHHLDEETAHDLARRVRERVGTSEGERETRFQSHYDDAVKLAAKGLLTEPMLERAVDEGQREFVIAGLAALAHIPLGAVRQIIGSRLGKPICALVWKAGLSMRLAMRVQRHIANIPATDMINARNGLHFPMTQTEMEWHLDFFIPAPEPTPSQGTKPA